MRYRPINVRLCLELAAVLVLAELAVMVLLHRLGPTLSESLAATLDAILLVAIASPLIVWRLHVDARSNTEPSSRTSGRRLTLLSGLVAMLGIIASISLAIKLDDAITQEASTRRSSRVWSPRRQSCPRTW